MKSRIFPLLLLLYTFSSGVKAQDFFNNLLVGIGGGVNFTDVHEGTTNNVFEWIDADAPVHAYSPLFGNAGWQYFFHAEYKWKKMRFALLPGTYSRTFSETIDETYNTSETVSHDFVHKLRYTQIPLQVKMLLTEKKWQPFIGAEFSYGRLLTDNSGFVKSSLSAGPIAGVYFETFPVTYVFTAGYRVGLHSLNDKVNRYDSSEDPFAVMGDISLNNVYASLSLLFSLNVEPPIKGLKCTIPDRRKP